MNLIDTHNHLGHRVFDEERSLIIQRCLENGIKRQVIIETYPDHWQASLALCLKNKPLHLAIGFHPLYLPTAKTKQVSLEILEDFIHHHLSCAKLCAVGEIGLDYFIKPINIDKAYQQQLFLLQLNIAIQYQLPALLHVRRAHADTITCLKKLHFTQGGIVHAFSGSYEEAKNYISLGFKLGLGGAATWPQATRLHKVIQQLPLDAIVLETDAPDMLPYDRPNPPNSPEYLVTICEQLATIKGISPEQLATASTFNACQVFNWNTRL